MHGSLGIQGVGHGMAAALAEAYVTWDPLWADMKVLAGADGAEAAAERLRAVPNLGEYVEGELAAWARSTANQRAVEELTGLLPVLPSRNPKALAQEGLLQGVVVMFTGKMQGTREEVQVEARSAGATVATSVSGKLSFLVAGSDAGTAKLEKAAELGVRVITEAEWLGMVRGAQP